jgi:hypothetical protein
MMEQVARDTSRLLAIAMGDEHIEQGVHTEMLFF